MYLNIDCILLLSLLFLGCNGYSNQNHKRPRITQPTATDRRSFLVPSIAVPLSFIFNAAKVEALQPKNDALCGTGFFEHIYEYKCTAIGDIEDEGIAKGMSSNEVGLTDSLMGKLGLSTEESFNSRDGDNNLFDAKFAVDAEPKNEGRKKSKK